MTKDAIIKVTCAIIERNGKVLAAQRSETMNMPLKWEFPGGKVEDGEEPAASLVREIREELGVEVAIRHPLPSVFHDYGTWTIELIPYVCEIPRAVNIILHEHRDVIWKEPEDLLELEWPDADIPVIHHYLRYLRNRR